MSELLRLSTAERIQLVEDLWDSVAADANAVPERLPVSDADRAEVLRRSAAYRQNPSMAVPLDDVLDRIERSLE
ncbi:MAG TPA: addiction module protein [Longimicrobium sp.]|nr:addiction module protein [Longimicrobium sp.]